MREYTNRLSVPSLPILIDEDEIAAWLRVTPRTILNWTRSGKLPAPLKLGKVRAPKRWLAEDVTQWIREQAKPRKIKPLRFGAQDQGVAA